MLSIFAKLICEELGEDKYNIYFEKYNGTNKPNEVIFCDIYRVLLDKDIETLQLMLERLLGATKLTIRLNRQYIWVWLATVLIIGYLFFSGLPLLFKMFSILAVLAAFGYKSLVFVINRYCFIDANITLIYKTALFHRILTVNFAKTRQI